MSWLFLIICCINIWWKSVSLSTYFCRAHFLSFVCLNPQMSLNVSLMSWYVNILIKNQRKKHLNAEWVNRNYIACKAIIEWRQSAFGPENFRNIPNVPFSNCELLLGFFGVLICILIYCQTWEEIWIIWIFEIFQA